MTQTVTTYRYNITFIIRGSMNNFINSLKAHLYSRTNNPLIGSFLFYWVICNYKFIIVIFDSDLKAEEKFNLIKTLYPQNTYTLWTGFDIYYYTLLGNGFFIPLLLALTYIYFSPIPSKYIYKYWKNQQKEIQKIKQNIEDETPLTNKQIKKIRQHILEVESNFDQNITHKDSEISLLKENLSYKNNELESIKDEITQYKKSRQRDLSDFYKEENSTINNESTPLMDKLLYYIGENRDSVYHEDLGRQLNLHPARIEKEMKELSNQGYIELNMKSSNGRENPYMITDEGKNYLILKKYV